VVGSTLTAEVDFIGAEASTSTFAWYRGDQPEPIVVGTTTYVPNADDLANEIFVRVTPIAASGQKGEPKGASASAPIALPGNVHSMLKDWIDMGQKIFGNCAEGDKERQLLFRKDKIKVGDKASKKTLSKSEGYSNVSITYIPDSKRDFVLTIGSTKKKTAEKFQLHCRGPEGERDLIKLALEVFAHPSEIDNMPNAPTSNNSSLHLAAAGSITSAKADFPDDASSITSEQQTMADVEEHGSSGAVGASSTAPKSSLGKLTAGARKLSFTRGKK